MEELVDTHLMGLLRGIHLSEIPVLFSVERKSRPKSDDNSSYACLQHKEWNGEWVIEKVIDWLNVRYNMGIPAVIWSCVCVLNLLMQKNQGILLGVVGTDIPLQELMKLIPKHMVQSAVCCFFRNSVVVLIYITKGVWNFFICLILWLVRDSWVRLCHHKQRLHPDTSGPQTFGNAVS